MLLSSIKYLYLYLKLVYILNEQILLRSYPTITAIWKNVCVLVDLKRIILDIHHSEEWFRQLFRSHRKNFVQLEVSAPITLIMNDFNQSAVQLFS
jgi:hypothetical protein